MALAAIKRLFVTVPFHTIYQRCADLFPRPVRAPELNKEAILAKVRRGQALTVVYGESNVEISGHCS